MDPIILIGHSGSGKSEVGKRLGALGIPFKSSSLIMLENGVFNEAAAKLKMTPAEFYADKHDPKIKLIMFYAIAMYNVHGWDLFELMRQQGYNYDGLRKRSEFLKIMSRYPHTLPVWVEGGERSKHDVLELTKQDCVYAIDNSGSFCHLDNEIQKFTDWLVVRN